MVGVVPLVHVDPRIVHQVLDDLRGVFFFFGGGDCFQNVFLGGIRSFEGSKMCIQEGKKGRKKRA